MHIVGAGADWNAKIRSGHAPLPHLLLPSESDARSARCRSIAAVIFPCTPRRMAQGVALLVDEVLPRGPLRQWVQSVPFALR